MATDAALAKEEIILPFCAKTAMLNTYSATKAIEGFGASVSSFSGTIGIPNHANLRCSIEQSTKKKTFDYFGSVHSSDFRGINTDTT